MKPKVKWGLIAAVPLMFFVGLGRWLGPVLGLSGFGLRLFWIGFGFLGAIVGGAIFWFLARAGARREPKVRSPLEEDLQARLAELRKRLADAKRPGLQRLPAILLLGPPASGKSSAVLGSEIAAEQLSGDSLRGQNVVPTNSINAWFSNGTVLLETGNELRENPPLWSSLLKRIRPKRLFAAILTGKPQASRAAVVCFSCDELRKEGALEAARGWGRALRGSLLEMAQTLGVQLPVYVLFTKADEVASFSEYQGQLKEGATRQVLGCTLPPPSTYEAASYADRQHRTLKQAFDEIFRSLSLKRLKFLGPDLETDVAGGVYEFPREFGKLSETASQFLIELCKPSQLQVSPFLRGFYFAGREEYVVDGLAPPTPEVSVTPDIPAGATQVFDPSSLQGAGPPPVPAEPVRSGVRHQWSSLPRVFKDVIFRDDISTVVMREGQRVNLGRRVLLGASILAVLFLLTPWVLNAFSTGRDLQTGTDQAIQDLRATASSNVERVEVLRRLDVVRGKADTMAANLSRPFLSRTFRWVGLHPGEEFFSDVAREYFLWFDQILLSPALDAVEGELGALPAVTDPDVDYQVWYNRLYAYLMSTQEMDRGEADVYGEILSTHGPWARMEEDRGLARKQFEFYGRVLRNRPELAARSPDNNLIAGSRAFLSQLGGAEPFYLGLRNRANRLHAAQALDFDAPGARARNRGLRIPVELPGAFSVEGREYVLGQLNSDSLHQAETWVLGEGAVYDPSSMLDEIRTMYEAEFADRWEQVLMTASVAGFADEADASEKLRELVGGELPLIGLVQSVYQKARIMPEIHRDRFRPLNAFLELDTLGEPTGISQRATAYLGALDAVEVAMDDLARARPDEKIGLAQEISGGRVFSDAREAALELQREMTRGSEGARLAGRLSRLLDQPVQQAWNLVSGVEFAEINSWGQDFCTEYRALVGNKYPFTPSSTDEPSIADLLEAFKPGESLLSELVANLEPYVARYGGERFRSVQESGVPINPAFLEFLTNAGLFADYVFPPAGDRPDISFNLLAQLGQSEPGIERIIITTPEGTTECVPNNCGATRPIEWDGSESMTLGLSVKLRGESLNLPVTDLQQGPWAPFHFFEGTYPSGWRGPGEMDFTVRWPLPDRDGDVAVSVRAGRASWIFNPAVMEGLRCVPRIVGSSG
jgi:type VI secretion system protein ImpL